jgi:hypothetical protein
MSKNTPFFIFLFIYEIVMFDAKNFDSLEPLWIPLRIFFSCKNIAQCCWLLVVGLNNMHEYLLDLKYRLPIWWFTEKFELSLRKVFLLS